MSLSIRDATPDDASGISRLIRSLASFFLADPSDPDSAAAFFATIEPEAIRGLILEGSVRYHVAVAGGEVVATVAVREGTHLYHLFVDASFHGQGLARRLWTHARAAALAAGGSGRFTVNSSRAAVPVYQRFGFRVAGDEVVKDGIAFVPMVLEGGGEPPARATRTVHKETSTCLMKPWL